MLEGERRDGSGAEQPVADMVCKLIRHACLWPLATPPLSVIRRSICLASGWTLIWGSVEANAQTLPFSRNGELSVKEESPLSFGSFVVMTSGTRTIRPDGALADVGIIPVSGSVTRPAQFKVTYDRGSPSRQPLDIEIAVALPRSLNFNQDGLVASLAALQTDLSTQGGNSGFVLKIARCQTRLCSASFRVGGSLTVSQARGSGNITISLPVTATIASLGGSQGM